MKAKLILSAVIMALLLAGCCFLGDAREDFWKPGATATAYEATAAYGAEQLQIQLTAMAQP